MRRVRTVPWVPMAVLVLVLAGCNSDPATWRDLQKQIPSIAADQRDAAIEKFIAAKGGTPIVENQTRLIFLVKDKDGLTPRIVGDFNAWAVTPAGYDVVDRQADADRRHVLVVPREHVVHECSPRIRTAVRKEYMADPLNRRDGPGICRAAIGSADAVLRGAAGGRRTGIGAKRRGDRRDHRLAVAGRQASRVVLPAARICRGHRCAVPGDVRARWLRTTSRRWTCRRCSTT